MPSLRDFSLPDLGEGLTEGEILSWLVAPGDTVTLNQPIVEVETAKAAVEVPSPYAGVVVTLHHAAGETVDVGSPIITVDTGGDDPAPAAPPAQTAAPAAPVDVPPLTIAAADDLLPTLPDTQDPGAGLIGGAAPGGRTAVLVGYGPKVTTAKRRPRRGAPAPAAGADGVDSAVAAVPPTEATSAVAAAETAQVERAVAGRSGAQRMLAKPPVRKLARDLAVDLAGVTPTGPGGRVTRADVHDAAAGRTTPAATAPASAGVGLADERIPVKGIRKHTAAAMVASAFTAPHVTEFLTCDVTEGMALVARLRALPEFAEVRITPLTLVARALLVACRRHPGINASWDETTGEIVRYGRVNLGIAAATPRGLLVPNVKAADTLGLSALATAIGELTRVAREGHTPPADLAGGTITITNVGVFGVDTGTPILNPGEAAILAFGVVRDTPWVVDGEIVVRKVTTLALSFDHRLVDGQLGSEVLADVGAMLADPTRLLAWS